MNLACFVVELGTKYGKGLRNSNPLKAHEFIRGRTSLNKQHEKHRNLIPNKQHVKHRKNSAKHTKNNSKIRNQTQSPQK